MIRWFVVLTWILWSLGAGDLSPAREAKIFSMGRKVSHTLCDKSRLEQLDLHRSQAAILAELNGTICRPMETEYLLALYAYLAHPHSAASAQKITGYTHADRCPVCGMFIYKHPDWTASIYFANGKTIYFDGVKDLMKYYLYADKFLYDRSAIVRMAVPDFYTLRAIDSRTAFYVIGSHIRGPMGNELIAFATRDNAETFRRDHHGLRIVRFEEITPSLIAEIDRHVRR